MRNKTILLVEDDVMLLNSNSLLLERAGYDVLAAETLATAREHLKKITPNLIVLDIVLPDGNGLDFLRELRADSGIPVLLLTALNTNADMIKGLEAGGDDYLPKPFAVDIFLTRVKAMLRRAAQIPETLNAGALSLSVPSGQAFFNGEDMLLTQKEFALLLLFAQHENRVLEAEYLYEKIWGHPMNDDAGAVRYHISRLRKKLTDSGYTIASEYGGGYQFEKE